MTVTRETAGFRDDPARRSLKIAAWPAVDQNAWRSAMLSGDPLDPGGAGADWRPGTVMLVAGGYGRWLTWLDRQQHLDPNSHPALRVTPAVVASYIAELRSLNAPMTVLIRVRTLLQALQVMFSDRDWRWLSRIEVRLARTALPARSKRQRLVASGDLFSFGVRLMEEAELLAGAPSRQAVQYRDGLMIAFLAARPIRRRNFASIELGRHLLIAASSNALCFKGDETKTGLALEFPLPKALNAPLARYLGHYRQVLLRSVSRWTEKPGSPRAYAFLWIAFGGTPMTEAAFYDQIVRRTKIEFGHPLNPHLFRDCAATTIAIEDPNHVRITKSILGHTSLAASEQHYNHANSLAAFRLHQANLGALRQKMLRVEVPRV